MGPIAIFDKSALEMLSIDESCWLDNFFLCNITPLFYAECLADLAKTPKAGKSTRSSIDIVAEISEKTPSMSCYPNAYHQALITQDLIGNKVNMSNRIILAGGQAKQTTEGKIGVHYDVFPEVEAMQRWQKGEFLEIEAIVAANWRKGLSSFDFDSRTAWVKNIIPVGTKLSSLSDIKVFLDNFIKSKDKETFELAYYLFDLPKNVIEIVERRRQALNKPFSEFASYAAFCFKIDLFFYLSVHLGFISKDRPSNRIDIAYLYYLPFCQVFISNDKLHKKTAPLFMEIGQTFVDGQELKPALKEFDGYYSKLPDEEKAKGILSFALYPPLEIDNLVTKLWDKHLSPKWREDFKEKQNKKDNLPKDKELLKKLKEQQENSIPIDKHLSSDEADHIMITHNIFARKGKWQIIAQEIVDNANKSDKTDS